MYVPVCLQQMIELTKLYLFCFTWLITYIYEYTLIIQNTIILVYKSKLIEENKVFPKLDQDPAKCIWVKFKTLNISFTLVPENLNKNDYILQGLTVRLILTS